MTGNQVMMRKTLEMIRKSRERVQSVAKKGFGRLRAKTVEINSKRSQARLPEWEA